MTREELEDRHLNALNAIEQIHGDIEAATKMFRENIDDVTDMTVDDCFHEGSGELLAWGAIQKMGGGAHIIETLFRLVAAYHTYAKHMQEYDSWERVAIEMHMRHGEIQLAKYRLVMGRPWTPNKAAAAGIRPTTPEPDADKRPADGWLDRLMSSFKGNGNGGL